MKSQVLHTVWWNITGEAAGGIWHWSLLGVKGLIFVTELVVVSSPVWQWLLDAGMNNVDCVAVARETAHNVSSSWLASNTDCLFTILYLKRIFLQVQATWWHGPRTSRCSWFSVAHKCSATVQPVQTPTITEEVDCLVTRTCTFHCSCVFLCRRLWLLPDPNASNALQINKAHSDTL